MRHFFYRDDTAAVFLVIIRHLLQARWLAGNQIVRQVHEKWFIPDCRACTQHGVTQSVELLRQAVG